MLLIGTQKLFVRLALFSFYFFCISIYLGINELFTLLAILLILPYNIYQWIHAKFILNKYYLLLIFFLFLGSVLNIFISSNGVGGSLVIIGILGLAIFILDNPAFILKHVFSVLILFDFICFLKILVFKIDPNEFYIGMSRNYLGLILLTFNILYSFLLYVVKRKVNIYIIIISVVLSILFVGRSTIGAMLGLLLLNLLYYLKGRAKWLIVILLLGGTGAIYFLIPYFEELYSLSSFNRFGLETPRYQIWKDFFRYSTFYTYIFGMDTYSVPIIAEYEGNVHNGFINILARTGIGFVFFVYIFCHSIIRYLIIKEFYLLLLLLIISFRVLFDTGIFISNLGFIYYTLLLYPLFYKSNKY